MSDTDSFIDEVTEEVRRDRLFGYFRRYGWIPAVIIVALVGGTAYNEWSKAQLEQAAQVRGDALLDALELEDTAEQAAAFRAIAREEEDALAAKLLAAGVETEQAADLLKSVAADEAQPQYIRDLARLKMASTEVCSLWMRPPLSSQSCLNPVGFTAMWPRSFWWPCSFSAAIMRLRSSCCRRILKMPKPVQNKFSAWRN